MSDQPFSSAVLGAAAAGRTRIVCDIKPVSPRDGDLLAGRDPADVARALDEAGACALSVVTEPKRFGGSLATLRAVAAATPLPVLRKDFFERAGQIDESRDAGAKAVLLTLATIPDPLAGELYRRARELGIEAVVEVHTPEEMARAAALGPTIVGINNRDILQLEKDSGDVGVTEALAPLAPAGAVRISESSLLTPQDVARAFAAGVDAVLVGTAILRSDNLRAELARLAGATNP